MDDYRENNLRHMVRASTGRSIPVVGPGNRNLRNSNSVLGSTVPVGIRSESPIYTVDSEARQAPKRVMKHANKYPVTAVVQILFGLIMLGLFIGSLVYA